MKIIMFLEEATNKNEAFRILNRYVRRWKHSRIDFERTEPVRIYWVWEDEQKFGSNFKSVLRRLRKDVYNRQIVFQTYRWFIRFVQSSML